jgi:hypothetical protein
MRGPSDKGKFRFALNGAKGANLSEKALISRTRRVPSKLMTRVRFPSPAPSFAGTADPSRGSAAASPGAGLKMLEGEQIVPI